MRSLRLRAATLLAALGALSAPFSSAHAVHGWANHIDVSNVREIVPYNGNLYIATFGGLVVYDVGGDTFQQYTNVSGLPSNALTGLARLPDGTWYAGFEDIGVARFRLTADGLQILRRINQQIDGLASNNITSLAVWNNGVVIYGTDAGAGEIINDFGAAVYDDELPSTDVRDVLVHVNNAYVATAAGIASIDPVGQVSIVSGGPADANVFASDGTELWVGSSDGVRSYEPVSQQWTDRGLMVPARNINSMVFDGTVMHAGGVRFVFSYTGGVNWSSVDLQPLYSAYTLSSASSFVTGLATASGAIFAGASNPGERRGIGIVRSDGSGLSNLRPDSPGGNDIRRLSIDPVDGTLWASFWGNYVGKLNGSGTWINYNATIPESNFLSSRFNLVALAGSDGSKWFSTLSLPASPITMNRLQDQNDDDYGNDVWTNIGIGDGGGDGLGSLSLIRAYEDPAGNIWFLGDDTYAADGWWGIQIYNPQRDEWLQVNPNTAPEMKGGNISAVAFTPGGTAYYAVRSLGVYYWVTGGYDWANLTNFAGDGWGDAAVIGDQIDAGSAVESIAWSEDNWLWAGTSTGIYRNDGRAGTTTHINAYQGVVPGLLSATVFDVALDHDNNLWVATEQGLNRIHTDDLGNIEAYSTNAAYQQLLGEAGFPFSVISDLVSAHCKSLAIHPTEDIVYVGTDGGLSVFDFSPVDPGETKLDKVYVFPNPVIVSHGHDALKIDGVTSPVQVEIFNLEGQLVHSQAADTPGQEIWDLLTNEGFFAASGVYVVRISSNSGSTTMRVSVIQ